MKVRTLATLLCERVFDLSMTSSACRDVTYGFFNHVLNWMLFEFPIAINALVSTHKQNVTAVALCYRPIARYPVIKETIQKLFCTRTLIRTRQHIQAVKAHLRIHSSVLSSAVAT